MSNTGFISKINCSKPNGDLFMATITLHGTPFTTCGSLPDVGSIAPDFTLTGTDLTESVNTQWAGRKIILNIFPSVDTPVCAASVRQFNAQASALENSAVLCISNDLPFALGRFCGAEGLTNVTALSAFRHPDFGKNHGVTIMDGPLRGLLARAVIIINADRKIRYVELVPEIAQEPDYDTALKSLS